VFDYEPRSSYSFGPDRYRQALENRMAARNGLHSIKWSQKINDNTIVDAAMATIDADYEALCASMQLVSVR